jgi:hypothetical protein
VEESGQLHALAALTLRKSTQISTGVRWMMRTVLAGAVKKKLAPLRDSNTGRSIYTPPLFPLSYTEVALDTTAERYWSQGPQK